LNICPRTGSRRAEEVCDHDTAARGSFATLDQQINRTPAVDTLDAFVRKYDRNEHCTSQFGTNGVDRAFAVFVFETDIICAVAGQTSGTFPGESNAGGFDAFLRKYDATGNPIWTSPRTNSSALVSRRTHEGMPWEDTRRADPPRPRARTRR
jgi:hypothetical protein